MVCGLRLGLGSFILVQKTWDEFVVRVGMLALNPSPPFGLLFISPFMGISGLSVCAGKGVIRAGIGPSKSSQSLSIAHKWAVVND
ncbi:hypothetical protein Tco_0856893 [Tanacetum coccineum]|uniref:Uncharacterized protein n=1 Tax=Tanacetum coccineum TaxID=301880 RepID=A0ABQ5B5F1_9ASTR